MLASSPVLTELVASLQSSLSILNKRDIQTAANSIGQYAQGIEQNSRPIRLGDDCAAIPDGDGYLLLASEGIWPQLVTEDPWFAGWCAVMVNLSDIAAMGGYPVAMVDALWSKSIEGSRELWLGMQAASEAYGVPIVGGHTNCHSPYAGLAVSILGRAKQLITSFDAEVGDRLLMVINMAGAYRRHYPFWNAATTATPQQLRTHAQLLPQLAQLNLVSAGKDISMGGLAGTLVMLAEASDCGAVLNLEQIPRPADVAWEKWLTSFPSFGFLLSVPPDNVADVQQFFRPYELACEVIGQVTDGHKVCLRSQEEQTVLWNLTQPLTGFGS